MLHTASCRFLNGDYISCWFSIIQGQCLSVELFILYFDFVFEVFVNLSGTKAITRGLPNANQTGKAIMTVTSPSCQNGLLPNAQAQALRNIK
jgi:hypothetical protein